MIKKLAASIMPRLLKAVPKNKKWLYPFYLAGQLDIAEEEYRSLSLPEELSGMSLTYASDIHFGPLFHKAEADRLIEKLLGLGTEVLILGGDYGDTLENAQAFFDYIPSFPAQTKVFAILGNHDYGKPGQSLEPLLQKMRARNVHPLVNEAWFIRKGTATLAILGPDDIRCGKPDLMPLKTASGLADFSLLIPHSPDLIPLAQEEGLAFHLALCGHTHGGQITVFGRSLHASSLYRDRFRSGWYHEKGSDILVSNGVGTSILPMRLGTRPQIHKITLIRETKG